jgi:1-acyl-sn-glycerol-3-phosphate acyltransferase
LLPGGESGTSLADLAWPSSGQGDQYLLNMKHWSLGYEIIRTYVRFAFWLTHKRVRVTGTDHIPKGKPVVFAPNHQNALMDPLAVVCTNPLQPVWLARADIFQLKASQIILKYFKILPVYRIRDGKENLSNNEHIFQQVIEILENKQSIALFPEAAHSGKRQMLPHKKAIPRIALEAEEKNHFTLDLQIVPVGIYYDHYWKFNRSIIIEYGNPIGIDKYKEEYSENPQRAMMSLRDEIYSQLEPLTLNIKTLKYYHEYENLRQLAGEAYSNHKFFNENPDLQLVYAERELIKKIEELEDTNPEYFNILLDKTTEYYESLKKAGLSDTEIYLAGKANWPEHIIDLILFLISIPVFTFSFIFNALPYLIPRMIVHRKVKDTVFISTFNFVIGLVVFPLFYIFCLIFIQIYGGSWIATLILFFLMPLSGKIAFQFMEFYRDIIRKSSFLLGEKLTRKTYKKLIKQRRNLIHLILEKIIS